MAAVQAKVVPALKQAFGNDLQSVLLYGSVVRGGFVPGRSDVNLLAILNTAEATAVAAFGRQARGIIRKLRITAHLLTADEFRDSADVFPMEYLDIQSRNTVIHGEDASATLRIAAAHLRHQLEDRLRGNLTQLRQILLASAGSAKVLQQQLGGWYGPLVASFRGLLRLKDVTIPAAAREQLTAVAAAYAVDLQALAQLLELREGRKSDAFAVAAEVHAALVRLVAAVDAGGPARS